jgi:hypothetical protein
MKQEDSSETLVPIYQITWRHDPEDGEPQISLCYTNNAHQIRFVQPNEDCSPDICVKRAKYESVALLSTASVVKWSEFLATDPEVRGSFPGASRFSEKQRVWNGVHSASSEQLRSYLGKVAALVLEERD